MTGGTVTVVSHAAGSVVVVTRVLGAFVDTITGTDVVTSIQTGIRNEISSVAGVNAKTVSKCHMCL